MKTRTVLAAVLLAAAAVSEARAASMMFEIDPAHSSIGFKVRHMMVSKVAGKFGDFSGAFAFDPERMKGSVETVIRSASIDTGSAKRDEHLRSEDFLDAGKYPELRFTGSEVRKAEGKDRYRLDGKLTIKGVSKPVELLVTYNGQVKDPRGVIRAGFSASTTIDRTDFGVSWNKTLDTGGLVVGDEVEIFLEVEGVLEKGSK